MISKDIIKAKGFWKSVFLFSLVCIVVTNAIRIFATYGFDFSTFVAKELSADKLFLFFVSNILLWIVVGFVWTYFVFKRTLKK